MAETRKARAMGVNHVALEVGDIEEALAFYGRLFEFKLRGKSEDAAFIDLGDQFLALQKGRRQPGDDGRHLSFAEIQIKQELDGSRVGHRHVII
jgi:lactoylglutathione lyase